MSQTTLTSFFPVRKQQVPDQHAAKKRKIILSNEEILKEIDNSDTTLEKENIDNLASNNESLSVYKVLPDVNADSEKSVQSDLLPQTETEVTSFVVTSAVDNHNSVTVEDPATPSSSSLNESSKSNLRKTKNDAIEKRDWTPTNQSQEKPLFTIGTCSIAKKKLDMGSACKSPSSRRVTFRKLGILSPKVHLFSTDSPKKSKLSNIPTKPSPMKLKVYQSPLKIEQTSLTAKCISKDLFGTPTSINTEPWKASNSLKEGIFEDKSTLPIENKNANKRSFSETKDLLGGAIIDAKELKAKLKPRDVKAKLGNVKLADLRNRLAALNNSSLKVKEAATTGVKITLPSRAIDLEIIIPPSPKKTPSTPKKISSGVKASPRKVPAYQRFHSLTQPTEKNLPLPYTYRLLEEVFISMDTVVSMHFNRNEKISKPLLAKSVKQMMNKPFLPSYLAQVHCVFPQAYHFKWDRIQRGLNDQRELYLRPNLAYKRALLEEFDVEEGKCEGLKMLSEHLVERRGIFRNSLVQLVKDNHADFLKTLDPPITVIDSKLTAWHREFDVDSCPEIDSADLPENPDLMKVGKKLDLEEKLDSIHSLAESCKTPSKTEIQIVKEQTLSDHLSGVSSSLVDKIRAKEAAKELKKMTRPQKEIDRLSLLQRLPAMARMLRNLLTQEKKAALPLDFVCRKLKDGFEHRTEKSQIEEDLRAMAEETTGWLSFHIVGKSEYLKIGKTDINKVCERLERKLKVLEG